MDKEDYKYYPMIKLPCGAYGINENRICGYDSYRCQTCFSIWGSIGCGCSNIMKEKTNEQKKGVNP